MADYISREQAIESLGEEPEVWTESEGELATRFQWRCDKNIIETLPSADVVSREVFEQIKWERDMAIHQLEELGYSLGSSIMGQRLI